MSTRLVYIITGAIVLGLAIVIGIGTFIILPTFTSTTSTKSHQSTTVTHHKKISPTSKLNSALKRYGSSIKKQIARALHLTSTQLKKQLRSGKTLSAVATAQGVSTDQLTTIIHDTFTNGLQPAVTAGTIDQQQVDNLVARYQTDQKSLEVFLGAGKKAA